MVIRFPPGPVHGCLADLRVPDAAPETLFHCADARVAVADYPLLLHDFPFLRRRLGPRDEPARAGAVVPGIDDWLVAQAAFVSRPHRDGCAVNSAPAVDSESTGHRPPGYGRSAVRRTDPGPDDGRGLLDLKGVGRAPGAVPSHAPHSDGLEYLTVALADHVMRAVVEAILARCGSPVRTLPVYAVLDLGIDILGGWYGTGPAGAHVRRAHRRRPEQPLYPHGSREAAVGMQVEMTLRGYGLTTTTAGSAYRISATPDGVEIVLGREGRVSVTGEKAVFELGGHDSDPFLTLDEVLLLESLADPRHEVVIERANVQFSADPGDPDHPHHLFDFSHLNVRDRFTHPVAAPAVDRPLGLGTMIRPGSEHFVQPADALALDTGVMNRNRLNATCARWADGFRAGRTDRAALAAAVQDTVRAACHRWWAP